jgi:hypothetical protein
VKTELEVSFTLSMCYCPSFDTTLDSDQTPCNSGYEFIQEIGAMRFWHHLVCDLSNYALCGYIENKADPSYA